MELTDAGFVAKARSGDADAFRVLVERHSRALFRLAFRMTGNEQDAEDVVQESFLRAYRQLGKFDERAELWHLALPDRDQLLAGPGAQQETALGAYGAPSDPESGRSRGMSLPSTDPTPERVALSSEVRERVAEAMNDLSATERTAFVLRHFEGMCIEEVSRVLECQPGAAKHSVFRAVQKLRRALEPW